MQLDGQRQGDRERLEREGQSSQHSQTGQHREEPPIEQCLGLHEADGEHEPSQCTDQRAPQPRHCRWSRHRGASADGRDVRCQRFFLVDLGSDGRERSRALDQCELDPVAAACLGPPQCRLAGFEQDRRGACAAAEHSAADADRQPRLLDAVRDLMAAFGGCAANALGHSLGRGEIGF